MARWTALSAMAVLIVSACTFGSPQATSSRVVVEGAVFDLPREIPVDATIGDVAPDSEGLRAAATSGPVRLTVDRELDGPVTVQIPVRPEVESTTLVWRESPSDPWLPHPSSREGDKAVAEVDHLSEWDVVTSDPMHEAHEKLSEIVQGTSEGVEEAVDRIGSEKSKKFFDYSFGEALWKYNKRPIQRTASAMTRTAEDFLATLSYNTQAFLGNRGNEPDCSGDTPAWVLDIATVEHPNAPLLACGEADGETLLLHLVANRGYGMTVVFPTDRVGPLESSDPATLDLAQLVGLMFSDASNGRFAAIPATGEVVIPVPMPGDSPSNLRFTAQANPAAIMADALSVGLAANDVPIAEVKELVDCVGSSMGVTSAAVARAIRPTDTWAFAREMVRSARDCAGQLGSKPLERALKQLSGFDLGMNLGEAASDPFLGALYVDIVIDVEAWRDRSASPGTQAPEPEGKPASTPAEALQRFLDAVRSGDLAAARSLTGGDWGERVLESMRADENLDSYGPVHCRQQDQTTATCRFDEGQGVELERSNRGWIVGGHGFFTPSAPLPTVYCVDDTTPLNVRPAPTTANDPVGSLSVDACGVHDVTWPPTTRDGWRLIGREAVTGWVHDSRLRRAWIPALGPEGLGSFNWGTTFDEAHAGLDRQGIISESSVTVTLQENVCDLELDLRVVEDTTGLTVVYERPNDQQPFTLSSWSLENVGPDAPVHRTRHGNSTWTSIASWQWEFEGDWIQLGVDPGDAAEWWWSTAADPFRDGGLLLFGNGEANDDTLVQRVRAAAPGAYWTC